MSAFDEKFGELKNSAKELGSRIGKGAQDLGSAASTKAKLEMEKAKLKDIYAELGSLYYRENKDTPPFEYSDLFERIEKGEQAVADYEEIIDKNLKNLKKQEQS
ncbi:hypothetical protein [Bilifractor sp. HCP3S3_D3]|uniref:hypothetical protein n=1 Tax=Bilifractor sp. HCP3S3_D3 TaxID=3438907 RepID=UPI002A86F2B6|nr:hypothetical protein [Bilifractor sp.]